MQSPPITAVTLDAGNTLLYCDPPPAAIYAHHLSRHGPRVSPDEVGPVFAAAWSDLQQRLPAGADRYGARPGSERDWWAAFVREVVRRLDHPAPWQPLLDDLYAAFSSADVWHSFPETRSVLRQLADRRLRLAVISNWDRRLPEILARLDIDHFFDVVTVSSLVGVEKPAPRIFQLTLDRLEVAPGAAVHVGDSPHDDYHGAAAAGLTPVLIDRRREFVGNCYRRIERLGELLELVA